MPASRHRELLRLARGIQRCHRCPLHRERQHAVPGEGPADAAVMLVGEAPGEAEDRSGRPFQGAAGRFLDELLAKHSLGRDGVFLTNAVKCRPEGNRPPRRRELTVCHRSWLQAQLDLIAPQFVVALGRTAATLLLGRPVHLARDHGLRAGPPGRSLLVTCHPAAARRFPKMARLMDSDFRALARRL